MTADEAVRMALENNLGVKSDRLAPQISNFNVPRRALPSRRHSSRPRNAQFHDTARLPGEWRRLDNDVV